MYSFPRLSLSAPPPQKYNSLSEITNSIRSNSRTSVLGGRGRKCRARGLPGANGAAMHRTRRRIRLKLHFEINLFGPKCWLARLSLPVSHPSFRSTVRSDTDQNLPFQVRSSKTGRGTEVGMALGGRKGPQRGEEVVTESVRAADHQSKVYPGK